MPSLPERLSDPTVVLHRWSAGRLDGVMDAVRQSFPELRQWMEWAQSMPTSDAIGGYLDHCVEAFDADEEWQYCVVEASSDSVVGGAGLHRRGGPNELEIGYWIRTDRCGRGYATAAARMLTIAAFHAPLGVESVRICMDRGNLASAAVPRKLGFDLVDEIEREIVTPGHTGMGMIWELRRARSGCAGMTSAPSSASERAGRPNS
jgi:RimJ/RimL family protein N-acetyltransferase